MKNSIFWILIALSSLSCKNKLSTKTALETEVFKTESDFYQLSKSKGIQEAFYTYADSNAVIKRENDTLIIGKENIKNYYNNPKFHKASAKWKPDYIDVSEDGKMAYTYGKYVWTVRDSVGNKKDFEGIFHTVWKKQKDGSWKYVWD